MIKKPMSTLKKFAILFLAMIVVALAIYLIMILSIRGKVDASNIPLKFEMPIFCKWLAIFDGGLLVIFGVIFLVTQYFLNKENQRLAESPKQPVDTTVVDKIFLEEFIKGTNIPHRLAVWIDKSNPPVYPMRDNAVMLRNQRSFVDPSGQTDDAFRYLQVVSRDGDMPGIHSFILRTDAGEDWIHKNWNWWIRNNKPFNMLNPENKKWPLTSGKNAASRLFAQMMQMEGEGYSPETLQMYNQILRGEQPQSIPQMQKPPAIATQAEVQQQTVEEETEEETPETDADEYRRKAR